MDVGQLFPSMPNRPTGKDFEIMSAILLGYDHLVDAEPTQEGKEKVWKRNVTQHIGDVDTLVYMAFQRTFLQLKIRTSADLQEWMLQDPAAVYGRIVMFMDGFVTGSEFRRRQAAAEAERRRNGL